MPCCLTVQEIKDIKSGVRVFSEEEKIRIENSLKEYAELAKTISDFLLSRALKDSRKSPAKEKGEYILYLAFKNLFN